jgi:hypothetical protein
MKTMAATTVSPAMATFGTPDLVLPTLLGSDGAAVSVADSRV